ncbi:hypothetical protein FACS189449_13710 [Alphaproteobacteria bacterium]|nr:hypothetical protein FACS189449_13710 [Alphaproteobacteria bacterium]
MVIWAKEVVKKPRKEVNLELVLTIDLLQKPLGVTDYQDQK